MRNLVFIFLLSVFSATGAFAQVGAKQFLCKMSAKGTRGWNASEILIIFVPGRPEVAVIDGLVMAANNNKPVAAKVLNSSGNSLRFVWKLKLKSQNQTRLTAQYTGTFDEAKMRLNVQSTLIGTPQSAFSKGICQPYKGK